MNLFPPTEERLAKLKAQGIVPLSSDLIVAGLVMGLCCGTLWLLRDGTLLLRLWDDLASAWNANDGVSLNAGRNILQWFLIVLFKLLLPAVLIVMAISLGQKGMRREVGTASINERALGIREYLGFGDRFVVGALLALKGLIVFMALVVVLLAMFKEFLADYYLFILKTPGIWLIAEGALPGELSSAAIRLGCKFVLVLCLSLLLLGLVSYWVAHWRFRRVYRMTRQEIEEEYKDAELSPLLKDALRRRIQE